MAVTFVIVWQFQVLPDHQEEFERAYGPRGDWARFFGRSQEYLSTELLRAPIADSADVVEEQTVEEIEKNGRDYFTIDRWSSADAYASFNERNAAEYEDLDNRFLELCEGEMCLGHFEVVE